MRVMALDAWLHRIMQAFIDLREAGRPSGKVIMAVKACLLPFARHHRPLRNRVVGVRIAWAVADLAGKRPMIRLVLDLSDVRVAIHA